jgi:hypothetical protein
MRVLQLRIDIVSPMRQRYDPPCLTYGNDFELYHTQRQQFQSFDTAQNHFSKERKLLVLGTRTSNSSGTQCIQCTRNLHKGSVQLY